MIDLLEELYEKRITEEHAREVLLEVSRNFHNGVIKKDPFLELMFDMYEASAVAHGVNLEIIAKWRYEGWPTTCFKCKKELNYKDGGWTSKGNKLIHFKCL